MGDATTQALVDPDAVVEAAILAKQACVVSGCDVAAAVFERVETGIACEILVRDAAPAGDGDRIMVLSGPARGILTGERTALNFMQRMTGIATLTSSFVAKAEPYGTTILDTRKTTPGLRVLEKYAVLCGGGENHRMGLYDRIMIKDNHRRLWRDGDPTRLDLAILEARRQNPGIEIEVEVESQTELVNALKGDPEWVLLDNMSPEDMARCVALCKGRCRTEASGGIDIASVEAAARSGVDAISLGCLTHSAPSIDLSLEIVGT